MCAVHRDKVTQRLTDVELPVPPPCAVPLPGRRAAGLQAVRDRGLRALQGRPGTGFGSLPLPFPAFGAKPPTPASRAGSGKPAAEVQPGSRARPPGSVAPEGPRLPPSTSAARSSWCRWLEGPRPGPASPGHHTPSPSMPPVRAVREGLGTSWGLPVLLCSVWLCGLSSQHTDSRHSLAFCPLRTRPALGPPPGARAPPPHGAPCPPSAPAPSTPRCLCPQWPLSLSGQWSSCPRVSLRSIRREERGVSRGRGASSRTCVLLAADLEHGFCSG